MSGASFSEPGGTFVVLLARLLKFLEAPTFFARASWPIVTFWLLTSGMDTFQWGYGAIRALVLVGIAALATTFLQLIPAIERSKPRRWLTRVVTILLLAHVFYCGVRLHNVTHLADIGATTLTAVQMGARGENPYTANLDDNAIAAVGPEFGGFKYLPVMPLVYAPLGLMVGNHGMLLTNLLLDLATAALIFFAAQRDGGQTAGLTAAAVYLLLPLVFGWLYAKGATDLVPVVLLLGSIIENKRRPLASGLLLGLSVSSKLLPGLAAMPACIPHRGRAAFCLGFAAGLLPTLLAWITAPRAFLDNIVRFNFARPADTSSWLCDLPPWISEVSLVAFGLVWLGLAVFALRYATRVTTRCSLVVLLLVAVLLAAAAMHQNYNLWWIPFLCVGLAVRTVSAVQPAFSRALSTRPGLPLPAAIAG
jgi:hypothetical protein